MPERTTSLGSVEWKDLYPRLLAYAHSRYLKQRMPNPAELAKDAVQTAFVRACRNPAWRPDQETFERYMFNAVRGSIYNYRNTDDFKNLDYEKEAKIIAFPDGGRTIEQDLMYRSEVNRMMGYLNDRNPDAAIVADLILNQELITSREIAEHLNPLATKKDHSRIDYLKKFLRTILKDYIRRADGVPPTPAERVLSRIEGGARNEN